MSNLEIKFYGGVDSVTGANFLLQSEKTKILIDCGIEQGNKSKCELDPNREDFEYDPSKIDFLIVTHAHADHIGRIPQLVKNGFRGKIYSTPQTLDLSRIMYEDALNINKYEAQKCNLEPVYNENDVYTTLSLWNTIPYHIEKIINNEFLLTFKNAGHILGSAIAHLNHIKSKKNVVFTGDLGNSPSPLINDVDVINDADYLIIESVYGDRNHTNKEVRNTKLKEVLLKVINRKGTLLIPVFSLEKTQVLLKELNDLIESGEVPRVPVFFDSPLGIKLTEIYAKEFENFNKDVQNQILTGDNIFDFSNLVTTPDKKGAYKIHSTKAPKIIIASSGMSVGGRIIEHEIKYLPDPKNAILFIGYQSMGSLGRDILEKKPMLRIYNKNVKLNAEVIQVEGYSSHMESDGLVKFVSNTATTLKKAFVVMGEKKSASFLADRLKNELNVEVVLPEVGESFEI